ncbi:MAG: hypothetical protein DRH33_02345 [Candidatus Nealsonbacteria bacterium]|nr:MAG: hypothetical protein DRH33_02345 [Candidatus Nealsonbacteria bacterium]
MKEKKGFTLIELLVVIAIIGILASIVMVTFPGATRKAKDARIMSAIAQARTIMVYLYDRDGDFSNFNCDNEAENLDDLCGDIAKNSPDASEPVIATGTAPDGNPSACIYSPLNSGDYYCADYYSGKADVVADPTATCFTGGDGTCGF